MALSNEEKAAVITGVFSLAPLLILGPSNTGLLILRGLTWLAQGNARAWGAIALRTEAEYGRRVAAMH